jgi:hypothetical protein
MFELAILSKSVIGSKVAEVAIDIRTTGIDVFEVDSGLERVRVIV